METILNKKTRDNIIERINSLNEKNMPQWGKMNLLQMMRHCMEAEEMNLGLKKHRQTLLGRVIGKFVLKSIVKDDKPLKKNTPTAKEFKIADTPGDIEAEKQRWISLLEKYEQNADFEVIHPFFGKMTKEQIGILSFKHADHHLRQFKA